MPPRLTPAAYQERVDLLLAFRAEHHRQPLTSDMYRGFRLGRWLARQRTDAHRGLLPDWQIQMLNEAGFTWHPRRGVAAGQGRQYRPGERGWQARLAQVVAWTMAHGAPPTQDDRLPDGFRIGGWLMRQRVAAQHERLPEQRKKALEDAGLLTLPRSRAVSPDRNAAWQRHYDLLLAYREQHGHADVPKMHVTAQGVRLGEWLRAQRRAQQAGRLPRERARALTAAGVSWQFMHTGPGVGHRGWLLRLEAYRERHGNIEVPADYRDTDGAPLGSWLADRQEDQRNQRLDADTETVIRFLSLDDRLQAAVQRTAAAVHLPVGKVLHIDKAPEDRVPGPRRRDVAPLLRSLLGG